MSKQTETLKLALEALEFIRRWGEPEEGVLKRDEAITAIREALAEQPAPATELREQQSAERVKPVAVVSGYYGGQCVILPIDPARIFNSNTALYTSPPASKPLTDEEILSIARDHYNPHQRPEISFARAIEAAHGIKENT